MNKLFSLVALMFLSALVFPGCEKCSNCSYTVNLLGQDTTYSESFCGSKKEMEDFESAWQTAGANSGVPVLCSPE